MTQLNFDVQSVEPSRGSEPLPAGWYSVAITAEENKQTKNGTGEYCEVEFTVAEGPHQRRKAWCRYNLWNTNQDTVRRAQQDLAALSLAIGAPITDTAQLLNQRCEIKLVVRKSAEFGDSNDVKGYRPCQSQFAQAPAAAAPVAAPPQPAPQAPAAAPQAPAPWNK